MRDGMDGLTLAISSLDNPLLTELSLILDDTLYFIIVVLLALFVFEARREKRIKVIAVLAVAFLLSASLKEMIHTPRSCALLNAKTGCPAGYSFPSNHAAVAFALMLAFINKPVYPLYFALAVFVAFSRVYLGVHTLGDVFAGLVIAPIAYQTVGILWKKETGKTKETKK